MTAWPTHDYVEDELEPGMAVVLVRTLLATHGPVVTIGEHRWRVEPVASESDWRMRLVQLDQRTGEPTGYTATASLSVVVWQDPKPTPPPPPRTSPVTVVYEGGRTVDVTPDTDWSTLRPDLPERPRFIIVPEREQPEPPEPFPLVNGRRLRPDQRAALAGHGYHPDLPPNGCTGDPRTVIDSTTTGPDGTRVPIKLRYRVCKLDGILIDGHETSDLDPGGDCLHCDADPDQMLADFRAEYALNHPSDSVEPTGSTGAQQEGTA